jgi:DNA (cytosine-5)-methyltransferase 3A
MNNNIKIGNVLSLFDGMSCGQIGLDKADVKYNKYYASEINKYAIQVTQKNYPDTIQLGTVTDIVKEQLPEIDLLIGGSPCQGFSFAGDQLNFDDPRSKLFFEFVRLKNELNPKYFLLENVRMKQEYQDVITEYLGVSPVELNSREFVPHNRPRLYWTNIDLSNLQIQDKKIYLKDVLGLNVTNTEDKICMSKSDFDVKVRKNFVDTKELCEYLRQHKGNKTNKQIAEYCNVPITKVEHWFRKDTSFAIPDEISWFKLKQLFKITLSEWDKKITEFEIKKNNFDMAKRIYHVRGKHPTLTTLTGGHQRKTITDGKDMFYLNPNHAEELQTLPKDYTKGLSDNQRFKVSVTVMVLRFIL